MNERRAPYRPDMTLTEALGDPRHFVDGMAETESVVTTATLLDRIRHLEALAERLGALAQQPTSLSSVELSQTAKGATQVTVKSYANDLHNAADLAQELYDQLTAKYATAVQP